MSTEYKPLIPMDTIVHRFSLRLLVLFGSHGTPAQRADSDIDLAYLSQTALSFEQQSALLHDLILHFRKAEMDLLDLQVAEPVIRAVIAQEGRVVYEAEAGLFQKLSLYYIKQRMDLAPMIDARTHEMGKRILQEVRRAGDNIPMRKN